MNSTSVTLYEKFIDTAADNVEAFNSLFVSNDSDVIAKINTFVNDHLDMRVRPMMRALGIERVPHDAIEQRIAERNARRAKILRARREREEEDRRITAAMLAERF